MYIKNAGRAGPFSPPLRAPTPGLFLCSGTYIYLMSDTEVTKDLHFNEFANEVHELALSKGWWDETGEPKTFGDLIALIHSELSEAFEEYRNHHAPTEIYFNEGNPKPEGIGIELADAIIRILDMCAKYGIDLDTCIRVKHEFNKTRPYRHGGKKI